MCGIQPAWSSADLMLYLPHDAQDFISQLLHYCFQQLLFHKGQLQGKLLIVMGRYLERM